MSSIVDEALEYAAMGWYVLPGKDKVPFLKWVEASTDVVAVTKMFEKFPSAEILVLCGPSKLAVLDVDIYKAPIQEKLPNIFDTWTAETPKGGRQYVFADPDSSVPTTAGRINEWTDTRGVGGLIVVPSVNSPKRRWTNKPPKLEKWPAPLFPGLGHPKVPLMGHTDEIAEWQPIVGERLPNEDCPGSYHLTTGRQPRLGLIRYPNGHIEARCWSGCPQEEIIPLLIESGRFTAEELDWREPDETVTGSSFITRDELMAIKPPTWMIEPYLQEGALVMLAAKFNTGKTFVAVEWAMRLASEGRKVLYLALEGLTGLQSRVRAWEEHNGIVVPSIRFNDRNFSLNLLHERAVSTLCMEIEECGGFDLVVVDNLGEAVPGDENDSATIGQAMHALNLIRTASGGTVLDLHNSGHGGQVRARGHSKMLDVHDTVIYLEPIEGSIHGLKVISGKERNAEKFPDRRALLKPVADSLVAVFGAQVVAQADPIYNAIKNGHNTVPAIEKYLDMKEQTLRDKLKTLLEDGHVREGPLNGRVKTYETVWDKPI